MVIQQLFCNQKVNHRQGLASVVCQFIRQVVQAYAYHLPSSLPLTHTHSQDFLQVEKCCHVEEPGAVGDLPHPPSVLSKVLNENQNTSCHLLRSSHQVTYKATWGSASATGYALKFQRVLRTWHWRDGKWKAVQWSGSSLQITRLKNAGRSLLSHEEAHRVAFCRGQGL